jgi:hypothetical protein
MHIAHCPSRMVVKIVVILATFFYILDYKNINYSIMFTILLNHFDRALVQPVHVSLVLDWVQISYLHR